MKEKAVLAYLNGEGSIKGLAIYYDIPSHSTLRTWIKRYTEGKENVAYSPKSEVYRMEKRKTTLEERIQIVAEN